MFIILPSDIEQTITYVSLLDVIELAYHGKRIEYSRLSSAKVSEYEIQTTNLSIDQTKT